MLPIVQGMSSAVPLNQLQSLQAEQVQARIHQRQPLGKQRLQEQPLQEQPWVGMARCGVSRFSPRVSASSEVCASPRALPRS